jgi:hypothetical protein
MNMKNMSYISFLTSISAIILPIVIVIYYYISYSYNITYKEIITTVSIISLSFALSLISVATGIEYKNKTKKFDAFSTFGVVISCFYLIILIIGYVVSYVYFIVAI